MSRSAATKTSSLIDKDKVAVPIKGLTHEQAAEVHAIRRLHERYPHAGITPANAADIMIEHLAMLLCGQSEYRATNRRSRHWGREIHRIWWNGTWVYLSYDPAIMRIVTYLPHTREIEKMVHYDVRQIDKKRSRRTGGHADD